MGKFTTTLLASTILVFMYCSVFAGNTIKEKETKAQPALNANSCSLTVTTGSIIMPTCYGAANGSVTAYPSSGTSPYTYAWSPPVSTSATASNITAGTYTVTVTDAAGCTATATAKVLQPPPLVVTINSDTAFNKCNGASWVTVSGGTIPYTYAWGTGGTSFKITGLCAGTYCVHVTDANGCWGGPDSNCIPVVFVSTVTAINQLKTNNEKLNIFPNPCNGQFRIESSVTGNGSVEIYNIIGEKIYSTPFITPVRSGMGGHNSSFIVDISSHPPGIYLCRIITDTGSLVSVGKIIVQ